MTSALQSSAAIDDAEITCDLVVPTTSCACGAEKPTNHVTCKWCWRRTPTDLRRKWKSSILSRNDRLLAAAVIITWARGNAERRRKEAARPARPKGEPATCRKKTISVTRSADVLPSVIGGLARWYGRGGVWLTEAWNVSAPDAGAAAELVAAELYAKGELALGENRIDVAAVGSRVDWQSVLVDVVADEEDEAPEFSARGLITNHEEMGPPARPRGEEGRGLPVRRRSRINTSQRPSVTTG